jgi:hypothetical protein
MIMLTVAERHEMLQTISCLSKEARGYRVRMDYSAMSDDELQYWWDAFITEMEERNARERLEEAKALVEWNEHIATIMKDHGISRADAIRWDMEATDCIGPNMGLDYYLWTVGLHYVDRKLIVLE